jgi:catechol 2,3-dioxygenase-like lactoylglutathione lyase family enzyme
MTNQPFIGLHHVALRTVDLDATVIFFQALGYQEVHHWRLPEYKIDKAVMMQSADARSWIELFDRNAAIPMQGAAAADGQEVVTGAIAHMCLAVRDLDTASAHIIAAGALRLTEAETLALGDPIVNVRNAIFTGPSGVIIELLQAVSFPLDRAPLPNAMTT